MQKINSFDEFKALKNNAVREKRLRRSNFIMPDFEIEAHIQAGVVAYKMNENCLLVNIWLHGMNYLYFWLKDPQAAFLPDNSKGKIISFYGRDNLPSIFGVIAENLGFVYETRAIKFTAKVADMTFRQPSVTLRDDIEIVESNDITYNRYFELVSPYFDANYSSLSPKYLYEASQRNITLLEAKIKGETIGFLTCHSKGNTVFPGQAFVSPEYRGLGIYSFLRQKISAGFEKLDTWIHDWNIISQKASLSHGLKPTGDYRAFYKK